MKSFISPKVRKRESHTGYGLFAIENIEKGERIVDFSSGPGTWLHTKGADELYGRGEDYMLQTDDDLFFAASDGTDLEDADFINHACEPNCGIRGSLEIVAMRDIPADEEIAFDYAMSESSDFRMTCSCGSLDCRRTITGEDWRIPRLQDKYEGYFSNYLQRRISSARRV